MAQEDEVVLCKEAFSRRRVLACSGAAFGVSLLLIAIATLYEGAPSSGPYDTINYASVFPSITYTVKMEPLDGANGTTYWNSFFGVVATECGHADIADYVTGPFAQTETSEYVAGGTECQPGIKNQRWVGQFLYQSFGAPSVSKATCLDVYLSSERLIERLLFLKLGGSNWDKLAFAGYNVTEIEINAFVPTGYVAAVMDVLTNVKLSTQALDVVFDVTPLLQGPFLAEQD